MKKQIDQSPRDYRAEPVDGEPALHPGGVRWMAVMAIWLVIGLAIAALLSLLPWHHLYDAGYGFSCRFVTGTCS